ncbi:MAG: glycosyltransferase family 4 protein [Alphaproteobacteria bacterium]|nr:glycosyltransferase family 4 protein [Alphaproteobacteria bacterium]
MKIILDNIGFSLQRMGGLSVVWGALLKTLGESKLSYVCLEYPWDLTNEVRQSLVNINVEQRSSKHLMLERYLDPKVVNNKPFIFHSSHYRICRNKNAINITTVHDFTYEKYRKGLALWVHSWQKFRAIKKADVVVCISENTKRDVLYYLPQIDESKIRIINNGVSVDYKIVETDKYSYLGEYVVFVGSRQPYKQFDLVVRSLKDTPYKLAIVGGKLNDEELLLVNETLEEEKYVQLGYLSNVELNELYNQAFCLAYPSSYEGFGIPVLEAQRAGCPVIAYNASSIPEVIGETPLLMNELTISDFRSKLEILKDKVIRDGIIAAGLENAKRFSWDKMGNEYVALYKELLIKAGNYE